MRIGFSVLAVVAVSLALPVGAVSPGAASVCDPQCQALAALADLRSSVEQLVPEQGLATSLLAKVDAATASVEDSRITPALNQIDAFANELAAAERSGQVSESTSNALKSKHEAVKQTIQNLRS